MMMKPPEIIETQRLKLRPPVMADAEAIFTEYAQDAEVATYMIWRPHKNIEETRDFIRRCVFEWENGSAFSWVIQRKDGGRLMGMIESRIKGHMMDIGYVLAREHWGLGYMPEAARPIVDWALAQSGIFRVWALCDVDNLPSARVMEKIGMRREGILRRWTIHPNISDEPRDAYCYSIVK
ncbi:MAG: GNAT family N-acetyltransferase [Blastocatellales bacterium]